MTEGATEFPPSFLWGTATSAYQVEGSPLADGAGASIWHRFAHTPGLVLDGDTGDVACDQYRRYAADVALMQQLGLNGYRFSIAWSRVLPQGRGSVNAKGLDHYERLVDTLLAPGHRNAFEAPIATHRLLRAHAAAVQAYRALGRHRIGIVVNLEPKYPASDSADDRAATARAHAYMNRQYLDPVFFGRYPAALAEIFGEAWPRWPDDEMQFIRQPIDFVGVNYYTRSVTRFDPAAWPLRASAVRQKQVTYTETGWEVYPQGLTDTLLWVKARYGNPPVYVTENGAAFYDPPRAPGNRVADPLRVAYYREHLRSVLEARAAGADVRGYFAWSLLDNFEWALGYSRRFGLVHVDFESQKRTPKDSAHFYSQVIATRGGSLAADAA